MTRTRLSLLVITAVLLWPSPAHAAQGFWGWLEELSGPGPFTGWLFSTPVACRQGDEWVYCGPGKLRRDSKEIRRKIELKFGVLSSDERQRFQDLPKDATGNVGSVYAVPVTVVYAFRLHRTIEAGPGVGFLRISGSGFKSLYRLTLSPVNATIRPLLARESWENNRWARVVRFEFDTLLVTAGFDGADFGNSETSFRSGREFLTKIGFVLDFGEVIWR
jgi:hypothetical protein